MSSFDDYGHLTDNDLFKLFKEKNGFCGPITKDTRPIYIKSLSSKEMCKNYGRRNKNNLNNYGNLDLFEEKIEEKQFQNLKNAILFVLIISLLFIVLFKTSENKFIDNNPLTIFISRSKIVEISIIFPKLIMFVLILLLIIILFIY